MDMTEALADRLLARSVMDGDCRRWTGAGGGKGYGSVSIDGKSVLVHRVAYELWVGPIPEGYQVDHVFARGCVHKDCINPDHLEAVTGAENIRRGHRARAVRAERHARPTIGNRRAAEILDRPDRVVGQRAAEVLDR